MKSIYKKILSIFAAISIVLSMASIGVFAIDESGNAMSLGVDNNSFNNDVSSFVTSNEKSKYYVTATELNKLKESESEDTQMLLTSQALSDFNGSCYGIASSMALSYAGKMNLPESNFYSVDITKHSDFRCRINFYQLSQYCENKYPHKTDVVINGKSYSNALKQMVEFAKVGNPFIITFRTQKLANSVVACGYKLLENGSHAIRLIDCNKKDDFIYFNISSGYNSWSFENAPYNKDDVIELSFSKLEVFNSLVPEIESEVVYSTVPSSKDIDTVCAPISSDFVLTNDSGKSLTFKNGEISGDIDYKVVKYVANSGDELSTNVVFTIEDSDAYILTNNSEKMNVTLIGDNGIFFSVHGLNIDTVRANEGKVAIKGNNMEYSASVLSTEENVDMLNINGADSNEVVIETKNGVTVSNAESGKAHVTVVSYGQFYEKTIEVEEESFNILYSMIATKDAKKGSSGLIVKLIITVLVIVILGVAFAIIYKKYFNKIKLKKEEIQNG